VVPKSKDFETWGGSLSKEVTQIRFGRGEERNLSLKLFREGGRVPPYKEKKDSHSGAGKRERSCQGTGREGGRDREPMRRKIMGRSHSCGAQIEAGAKEKLLTHYIRKERVGDEAKFELGKGAEGSWRDEIARPRRTCKGLKKVFVHQKY